MNGHSRAWNNHVRNDWFLNVQQTSLNVAHAKTKSQSGHRSFVTPAGAKSCANVSWSTDRKSAQNIATPNPTSKTQKPGRRATSSRAVEPDRARGAALVLYERAWRARRARRGLTGMSVRARH